MSKPATATTGVPVTSVAFPRTTSEALVGYHIRQGHYGAVSLDGLDCIMRAPEPNPIHEGHGTATLFITEQASPEQRDALTAILTGQAGAKDRLPFRRDDYDVACDAICPHDVCVRWPSESFCGPRVSGCRARGFTNPVTGAPNNLKIELESGFIWKGGACGQDEGHADFRRGLTFDHSGQNAFHTVVEFHEV